MIGADVAFHNSKLCVIIDVLHKADDGLRYA